MASRAVERRAKALPLNEGDWHALMPQIRTKFLDEREEVDKIVSDLRERGVGINKQQLQTRLKNCGIRKNLPSTVWKHVAHTINARRAAGKKTALIVSGRRLPDNEIEAKITRHAPPRLSGAPPPEPPDSTCSMYLVSPAGSSTDLLAGSAQCIDNLPWSQFCKTHLGPILQSISFLPASTKAAAAAIAGPDAMRDLLDMASCGDIRLSKPRRTAMLSLAFVQLGIRSLHLVTKESKMTGDLICRKSVDQLAARFNLIIPEVHPHENRTRAVVLIDGRPSDVQAELLKIIIYLASNMLLPDLESMTYRDDAKLFITVFRLSGMAEPKTIKRLVEISYTSLTLTAVVSILFQAAIHTEAADLVAHLLAADNLNRLDANKKITLPLGLSIPYLGKDPIPPTVYAVARGSVPLATALLNHGANLYMMQGLSPIAMSILMPASGPAHQVLRLLLERGLHGDQNGKKRCPLSGLQAAIVVGDIPLIRLLLDAGSNVNHKMDFGHEAKIGVGWRFHTIYLAQYLGPIGCFELAASFRSGMPPRIIEQFSFQDEQRALDLCELISGSNSGLHLCDRTLRNAMILAAHRGYARVLSYLRERFSAPLDASAGGLTPLYAALRAGRAEACRRLLLLGAPVAKSGDHPYIPAPLHYTIIEGNCELVKILLLQRDCSINDVAEMVLDGEEYIGSRDSSNYADCWWLSPAMLPVKGFFSPLNVAVRFRKWDIALLLATSGADATADDVLRAASANQFQLIETLLGRNTIHLDDTNETSMRAMRVCQEALTLRRYGVARQLLSAGASLDVVSVWRIPDAAQIQDLLPQSFLFYPQAVDPDSEGRKWLEIAILGGNREVIELALTLDSDYYDSGALCAAVYLTVSSALPNNDIIVELVQRRSRCSSPHPVLENTALALAASHSRLGIMELLLQDQRREEWMKDGAIPADKFVDGEGDLRWRTHNLMCNWHIYAQSDIVTVSPLCFALWSRSEEAANLLLDHGYKADGFVMHAAISADASHGLVERVAYSRYDVDAESFAYTRRIEDNNELPVCSAQDQLIREELRAALCLAVQKGRRDAVQLLLACGADINSVDDDENSAVSIAVAANDIALLKFLIDRGADVNNPWWSPERLHYSAKEPLQVAAQHGYIAIARLLLDHGANVNAHTIEYGNTPLEKAVTRGHLDIVKLLLDSGAKTDGYHRFRYVNAVREASKRGYSAIEQLLRSHGGWTGEYSEIVNDLYHRERAMNGERRIERWLHPTELSVDEAQRLRQTLREKRFKRVVIDDICSIFDGEREESHVYDTKQKKSQDTVAVNNATDDTEIFPLVIGESETGNFTWDENLYSWN